MGARSAALCVVALVALLSPSTAFAHDDGPEVSKGAVKVMEYREPDPDEPATTGVAFLITGGVFGGVGALSLATAPVCTLDFAESDRGLCLGLTAGAGGVSMAFGIALIAAGLIDYTATEKRSATGVALDVTSAPGEAGLGLRATF
jgi:MFS family permease